MWWLLGVVLHVIGFLIILPIMTISNLICILHFLIMRAWNRNANFCKHETNPGRFTIWKFMKSKCNIVNIVTIDENIDFDKLLVCGERYKKAINMNDRDVVFKKISLPEDVEESITFDELYTMHTQKPTCTSPMVIEFLKFGGKSYIMGRMDFSRFDGTSCFNFMKSLIEFYYSGNLPSNRPTLTLDHDIVDNISISEVICLAVSCTFGFALLWGRRIWEPDFYALFFPSIFATATYHTECLDKKDTSEIIALAKKHDVKPFVKFMWSIFRALEKYTKDPFVYMLTQISCQWRFFSPRMPRDQIGYWLIDSSCRIQWKDTTLSYCEGFYENLKKECAELSGNVREGWLAQTLFGYGGMVLLGASRKMLWFNNYGVREIKVPEGVNVQYHWCGARGFATLAFFNMISLNGQLCLTLSSSVLCRETLMEVNKAFFENIHKVLEHKENQKELFRKRSAFSPLDLGRVAVAMDQE